MRKALRFLAVVLVIFVTFQACGPNADRAKAREIIDAVVATPPLGYVASEVEGGNWLSTAGDAHNLRLSFRKSLTTQAVDSACSYLINWASTFGATKFRDGQLDGNTPLIMLSGNEDQAEQTCVEVLSLVEMDPGIESGSAVWQMFGNYHGEGTPDFGMEINHSYQQEADNTEFTHTMNVSFFTIIGIGDESL